MEADVAGIPHPARACLHRVSDRARDRVIDRPGAHREAGNLAGERNRRSGEHSFAAAAARILPKFAPAAAEVPFQEEKRTQLVRFSAGGFK